MSFNKTSSRPVYLAAILGLASVLPLMALAEVTAKLTEEPTHGSIQVTQQMSETDLAKLATLTQAEATAAAWRHC